MSTSTLPATAGLLTPDQRNQLNAFFDAITEPTDRLEVRFLPPFKSKRNSFFDYAGGIVYDFNDEVVDRNVRQDVYFGVNPRSSDGGTEDCVELARCLFADFDHIDAAEATKRVAAEGLPHPTAVVSSGHGVHCYWRLEEPIPPSQFRAHQKCLAELVGSDSKVCDPPRIMRMPYTAHVAKRPKGSKVKTYCTIVAVDGGRHRLDTLSKLWKSKPVTKTQVPSLPAGSEWPLPAWALRVLEHGSEEGNRNGELFGVAAVMKGNGWDIEHAKAAVVDAGERCSPPLSQGEALTIVRSAYSRDRTPGINWSKVRIGSALQLGGMPKHWQDRPSSVIDGAEQEAAQGEPQDLHDRASTNLAGVEQVAYQVKPLPRWAPPDDPPSPSAVTLAAATPFKTAIEFVKWYRNDASSNTFHRYRGDFYAYDGTAYRAMSDEEVRAMLYEFVDKHKHFNPNRSSIGNAHDALKAKAFIRDDVEQPGWVGDAGDRDGYPGEASDYVPMQNGLLHMPSQSLYPHTPALFATNSLTFGYASNAGCPGWRDFLKSVWGDDVEQIDTLQEWIGYLVSGSTSQQKVGLIVGPKRSGKGTISRVVTALLGLHNCCSPTLASLTTQFGLWPLIGKTSAIVSDARFAGKAESQASVAERLLSISGEDTITVDRKNRDAWTGKLGARFTIMSNELPRVADSSGALAGRFVVMVMSRSFYGNEDTGLTDRLLAELPGIFNWAMRGARRLEERGYFQQPKSSVEAVQDLETLGSPAKAFVDECCEVCDLYESRTTDVFTAWQLWCKDQGRDRASTSSTFGRDLLSAVSDVKKIRKRSPSGGRYWVYAGLELTGDWMGRVRRASPSGGL